MEAYAYRENLESILAFTGNRNRITINEALAYLNLKDARAVHRRCPHFVGGWTTAATFAMDLCNYSDRKGRRK